MPQVTLDLVSFDNKPCGGLSRRFEGRGGTIGRDEASALPLPDPHRRVSRLHAAISFPEGVPTITNASEVLPICVGGTQLACGQGMALVPGTTLEIGPYVLLVREVQADAAAPLATTEIAVPPVHGTPPFAPGASTALSGLAPAPRAAGAGDSAGRGAPMLPRDDPLALLLGPPAAPAAQPQPQPQPGAMLDPFAVLGLGQGPGVTGADSSAPGPPAQRPQPPAVLIPEDFNPFELPSASARNTADPLAAMFAPGAAPPHALTQEEASIDALFAPAPAGSTGGLLSRASPPADLFAERHGESDGERFGDPSSLLSRPASTDPLALFGDPAALPPPAGQPMRDDVAEIDGAFQPPRPLGPGPGFAPAAADSSPLASPPAAPPASLPAAPFAAHFAPPCSPLTAPAEAPASASPFEAAPAAVAPAGAGVAPMPPASAASPVSTPHPDALTRAFLQGARLPDSALPDGLTPEIMTMVGALLRGATAGAVDMLAIRANIKREVQASVTIISNEANNPLKFLHDADSVLQLFLGKRLRGFMAPEEAMKDAFNDLGAHELGVIAGTRAALNEVLTQFDPAHLGERLVQGSLLEKALPAMRKTRLWDLYQERYAKIRLEVEDDFQSVFGKAFVAAYEAESARMKARSDGS